VAAPVELKQMLDVCAQLAVAALSRQHGNVIVFLPGLKEIITTQKLVYEFAQETLTFDSVILHSEVLGDHEDQQELLSRISDECPLLVLASSVAARAITLPDMKYVFLHPHTHEYRFCTLQVSWN
jgi:HrpA-like RNA helicase